MVRVRKSVKIYLHVGMWPQEKLINPAMHSKASFVLASKYNLGS